MYHETCPALRDWKEIQRPRGAFKWQVIVEEEEVINEDGVDGDEQEMAVENPESRRRKAITKIKSLKYT